LITKLSLFFVSFVLLSVFKERHQQGSQTYGIFFFCASFFFKKLIFFLKNFFQFA
jgi:hypothetical protein